MRSIVTAVQKLQLYGAISNDLEWP